MPSKKVIAKPGLPLWFWAFGIAVIGLGVWLSWPGARSSGMSNSALSNQSAALGASEAIFTDYFDVGWRSGNTQVPILVEATYFFPELVSALESLPTKSGHQGEVADRLALVKPNTDTIVFYVTLASPGDEVQSLDPEEIVGLVDEKGNAYSVQQWSEANALLLPASEVTQRIGLIAFSRTADNGKKLEENNVQQLSLAFNIPDQSIQTLTWDLAFLATFLQSYER